MTNNSNDNGNLFVAAILAILFVLVAASGVWATQVRPATRQAAVGSTTIETAPAEGKAAAPAAPVDMDKVIAAINKGGCIACHTIPGIPNAQGQVGPNLSNIGVDGANRREGYTAEQYIRESITNPTAFTAPECPTGPCVAGMMPQIQLDEAEVDVIVSYLSTLGK